jgi:hypothetical protein
MEGLNLAGQRGSATYPSSGMLISARTLPALFTSFARGLHGPQRLGG